MRDAASLSSKGSVEPVTGASTPRPSSRFIGREPDIAAILDLVERDDVRLLTLTGPGGAGKTRLAWEVRDALQQSGHQTWFVSLAAIRDPGLAQVAIAQGVGVTGHFRLTVEQAMRDALRNQRGLLVLDNFEQVLPAAGQLPGLLAACPSLTLLVTSRIPLNLSAERVFPVGPLRGDTGDSDAVTLFIDRARAHDASFALDAGNTTDIQRICQRLGGLPLAIELAAARIAVLSPGELLGRLDESLSLLTGGPRDAPDRQRTMRDTIAWSYDLLSPQEQRVFRTLGVFVEGCTLTAAAAVAGLDETEALDRITELAGANLVTPMRSPTGQTRYIMLDTVRSFALERLAEKREDERVRLAHARFFMTLAEDAIPGYDGPALAATKRRVHAELANARAAIAWCIDTGERELAARLAGALWRVWLSVPLTDGVSWIDTVAEGHQLLEQVIDGRDNLPLGSMAEALIGASYFAMPTGNLARAEELAEELASRARTGRDRYAHYWALLVLSTVAFERGKYDRARRFCRAMLAIAPVIRDSDNQAVVPLARLALIDLRTGDAARAGRYAELALARARSCGNPLYIAWSLTISGRARRDLGELAAAFGLLVEAYEVARASDLPIMMQDILLTMAVVALRHGQYRQASILLSAEPIVEQDVDTRPEQDAAVALFQQVAGNDAFAALQREPRLALDDPQILAALQALRTSFDETAKAPDTLGGLTPREVEVLRLVAEGKSNRAIAEALSISARTVENHVYRILDRLDLQSRTEAATWAVRNGLAG